MTGRELSRRGAVSLSVLEKELEQRTELAQVCMSLQAALTVRAQQEVVVRASDLAVILSRYRGQVPPELVRQLWLFMHRNAQGLAEFSDVIGEQLVALNRVQAPRQEYTAVNQSKSGVKKAVRWLLGDPFSET